MNLSAKQIQALVRELVPVVAAKQKEQLESIKQEVKDECLTKVRNL